MCRFEKEKNCICPLWVTRPINYINFSVISRSQFQQEYHVIRGTSRSTNTGRKYTSCTKSVTLSGSETLITDFSSWQTHRSYPAVEKHHIQPGTDISKIWSRTQEKFQLVYCSRVPEGETVITAVWYMKQTWRLQTREIWNYKARLNIYG